MRHHPTLFALVICGGLALLPLSSEAQDQSDVHYFTDQELTSDKLIEVLKPTMRGIEPVSGKPHCDKYKGEMRGIEPVADIAAIKVLFAFDSAELTPEATQNLAKLGDALKSGELAPYCFRIEGHADNVGGDEYNQHLSEQRAQSVVQYLAGRLGVEQDRLLPTGYGETKPIADNATEEGRQKNRRVQIVNLGSGE